MSDRLTRHRWWIALLYGLVVVLAHGFHAHDGPVSLVGCETSTSEDRCGDEHSPDAAGQTFWDQAELANCETTCLSCDFSLSHQAALADQPLLVEPVRCSYLGGSPLADLHTSPSWARTRAPPLS